MRDVTNPTGYAVTPKNPVRKPVQIAASVIGVGEVKQPVFLVLADDGDLFFLPSDAGSTWKKLPPLPARGNE